MKIRNQGGRWLAITIVALSGATLALGQSTDDVALMSLLARLPSASYVEKARIAEELVRGNHASTRSLLSALLEDRLVSRNIDGKIFVLKSSEGNERTILDPVSLADAGSLAVDATTTIGTNNALRSSLRATLARYSITNSDPAVRLEAVRELARANTSEATALLVQRQEIETDKGVKAELAVAAALRSLDSSEAKVRLDSLDALKGSLHPDVRNRLARLIDEDKDGVVKKRAVEVLQSIDRSKAYYGWLETLYFGLSQGAVLVLVAVGLAITFGVVGVINMAHGELVMLGAYTTYVVQQALPQHVSLSVILSIPAAFLVSGAVGVAIEWALIRFLYGRPLETLLATYGVSLILQQTVRSLFSALNRSVEAPEWMRGSLQINDALSLTYNRLYILIFACVVFLAVTALMKFTRIGLEIRAVSQNRGMAQALGIRTRWIDAITFGLGSGIAGVAGVALSQLTNVGPNLGQSYIIDSFMVVVIGGVGSLWGSLVTAFSIGTVNNLLEPQFGAVLGKILVLLVLILFIQFKPRGLFPQRGRSLEEQ